jgi:hypothetical protein
MDVFLHELLEIFHQAVLAEAGIGTNKLEGLSKADVITLIELFTEASRTLSDSPIEELPVEIAVIKWCGLGIKGQEEKIESEETVDEEGAENPLEKKVESAPVEQAIEPNQESVGIVNDDIWNKILMEIHPVNVSIEGLLRASRPVAYDGKVLTLGVFYKFHKERLEEASHKRILEGVIEKVLNCPTRIACMLVEPPPKKIIEEGKTDPILTESKDNDIIKAAEEIFGN